MTKMTARSALRGRVMEPHRTACPAKCRTPYSKDPTLFASFLQGLFAPIIGLGAVVLGLMLMANSAVGAGAAVLVGGCLFAAYLKYLSRHTVRVRR